MKRVLVTGGAGYIGSHMLVELLQAGYQVVAADNLLRSSIESIHRVENLTQCQVEFHKCDLTDVESIDPLFESPVDAVLHFAALKSVNESVRIPIAYYRNNVIGTINLLASMLKHDCDNLVFSSSCTVYGRACSMPVRETQPFAVAASPYGASKQMSERIIEDVCETNPNFTAISLRYFNPIGCHPSVMIGESPITTPDNLMPYLTQVAIGEREKLFVFGNDYDTEDGTAIRDYLHITDLVHAHLLAMERLPATQGADAFNLGTGRGTSVLELISAFEAATGVAIDYEFAPRRLGDVEKAFADPTKAQQELGWRATQSLEAMCLDSWRWQQKLASHS